MALHVHLAMSFRPLQPGRKNFGDIPKLEPHPVDSSPVSKHIQESAGMISLAFSPSAHPEMFSAPQEIDDRRCSTKMQRNLGLRENVTGTRCCPTAPLSGAWLRSEMTTQQIVPQPIQVAPVRSART